MALSLKDSETDRLARSVAAMTGETLTEAVRTALDERLQRERLRRGQTSGLAARLRAIGQHCASLPDVGLPDVDPHAPEDNGLYDETGMWR